MWLIPLQMKMVLIHSRQFPSLRNVSLHRLLIDLSFLGSLNRMIGGTIVLYREFRFALTLVFRSLGQSISFYYFLQANFPVSTLPTRSLEKQLNRVKICLEINRLCFYR